MLQPIYPFKMPKVVWAAPGAISKLGPEARRLGATKVLLVTDRGLMATGAATCPAALSDP
jgi:alcohol dehydrogenase class IV